ncbi:hypothetical protein DIS18_11920 [Algibacter marinivivus]|uniref:Lipoprotein n=1 Tax=Algibacter marinivivus TaxID=2100723 RepID=A0A2U2X2J2_9FLAO|nr:hypothetical protein [Algibacter marinivivus]PWH81969.1 hypothetical protein DIS18_11920 [Algibacter marinivivus]
MKKILLISVLSLFILACNTRKQVEKAVNSGDYDQAINTALKKLRANKDKKRNYDYVIMLQDAYYKVTERDIENIAHLKKDNNPENYRIIFEMYQDLDARQNAIKPILPLKVNGKNITFDFNNYSDAILESKNKVSDYTYEKGLELLESDEKRVIREAYSELSYLERINPNYENTRELLEEAHQRGKDYILVSLNNDTQQIIPSRLEDDLLNFNTYGLNKFWSEYHVNKLENLNYDYAMQLNLKGINVSPERINEREFIREKEVVDGWEYKKDRNGEAIKDSLGKYIKIDKLVNVKARYMETIQTKSSHVVGDVVYLDLKSNQLLDAFPIDSEFVFEYVFARYRGDKRALNANDIALINNRRVPFPSNEQMVYDTGEDLKLQLKDIINSYAVR